MGQIAVRTAYMRTELLNFEIWPQSKQKSQSNCPAYMCTCVQRKFQSTGATLYYVINFAGASGPVYLIQLKILRVPKYTF